MEDDEQQEFEKYVKEEFDKMLKDYDRVHDVLWGALGKLAEKQEEPDYEMENLISDNLSDLYEE